MKNKKRVLILVHSNTYIYLVLLLFFVPLNWLLAWLLAVSFHEFCHWIAVQYCGGHIHSINIGVGGIHMVCGNMSAKKRLFVILSGPIGGFLLALFGRWLPRIALCSWVLSVYNLLPLLSLDGGKALAVLIGHQRTQIAGKMFLVLLSIAAIYASFSARVGVLPVIIVSVLWLKSGKSPCKPSALKVQ